MRWFSLIARMSDRRAVRHKQVLSWHKWFAWHPVRINRTSVWLEMIERKADGWDDYNSRHIWTYRLPEEARESC